MVITLGGLLKIYRAIKTIGRRIIHRQSIRVIFFTIVLCVITSYYGFSINSTPSLLERHIFAGVSTNFKTNPELSLDIFTGEFPLLFSFNAIFNPDTTFSGTGNLSVNDFTLYTGLPRFIPFYGSIGKYSEAGYIDMYSSQALIRSAGLGVKLLDTSLRFMPYAFIASKYNNFSSSATIYMDRNFALSAGLFLFPFSFTINYESISGLTLKLALRVYKKVSLALGIENISNNNKIYFGVGLSHRVANDNDYHFGSDYSRGAHRGSLLKYPENTYPAFKYAENLSFYDFIEFDVYRTRDGHYVVVHDPILLRYTGELKRVTKLTLAELKKRDMGRHFSKQFIGTRIMSLEELSHELAGTNKSLVLEIKDIGKTKKDVKALLKTVKGLPGFKGKNMVFLSINSRITSYLRELSVKKVALVYPIFSLSDIFPPVIGAEIKHYLNKSHADMIFFYTPKLSELKQIKSLSKRDNFDYAFWNFHDIMYAHEEHNIMLRK